jgi:hypothetical protein
MAEGSVAGSEGAEALGAVVQHGRDFGQVGAGMVPTSSVTTAPPTGRGGLTRATCSATRTWPSSGRWSRWTIATARSPGTQPRTDAMGGWIDLVGGVTLEAADDLFSWPRPCVLCRARQVRAGWCELMGWPGGLRTQTVGMVAGGPGTSSRHLCSLSPSPVLAVPSPAQALGEPRRRVIRHRPW